MATMTETPDAELPPGLVEQVMNLPPAGLARLRALLDEVADDPGAVKEETRAELQRRWDEIQSGAAKTSSAEEALVYARDRLREGKQP